MNNIVVLISKGIELCIRNYYLQVELVKTLVNFDQIWPFFGHFWPNFQLRDFILESRKTFLANLSLVSRETIRDSATLLEIEHILLKNNKNWLFLQIGLLNFAIFGGI